MVEKNGVVPVFEPKHCDFEKISFEFVSFLVVFSSVIVTVYACSVAGERDRGDKAWFSPRRGGWLVYIPAGCLRGDATYARAALDETKHREL